MLVKFVLLLSVAFSLGLAAGSVQAWRGLLQGLSGHRFKLALAPFLTGFNLLSFLSLYYRKNYHYYLVHGAFVAVVALLDWGQEGPALAEAGLLLTLAEWAAMGLVCLYFWLESRWFNNVQ
jgi:hypothetical protein